MDYPERAECDFTSHKPARYCNNPLCQKKIEGTEFVGTDHESRTVYTCSSECLDAVYAMLAHQQMEG